MIGGRQARCLAIDIGQQPAPGIGNADAPHSCFATDDGPQALLQGRATHLALQQRQPQGRRRGGQGGQGNLVLARRVWAETGAPVDLNWLGLGSLGLIRPSYRGFN